MPATGGNRARLLASTRTGLVILAAAAALRAVSYTPWVLDQDRAPAHWLEALLDPWTWSIVWALVVILLVAAIRAPRLIPAAVGAVVALHASWCLSFLWVSVIGEAPRGWVTAISYGSTAALVAWAFARPTTRRADTMGR